MKTTKSEFWESRYRSGKTPWDFRGVPAALVGYLKMAKQQGAVLIPGCGSAYEVQTFSRHGYEVLAIDFSEAAVERARAASGELAGKVLLADFFKHDFGDRTFDLIYERTFLCSLPPNTWPNYARRMAELLQSGGRLLGFFLYGQEEDPPPYPLSEEWHTSFLMKTSG